MKRNKQKQQHKTKNDWVKMNTSQGKMISDIQEYNRLK